MKQVQGFIHITSKSSCRLPPCGSTQNTGTGYGRAEGVDVRVFERDRTPVDRAQGYRLTINAGGACALQSCLPKANFERYIEASAKISTAVTFFDHKPHRAIVDRA